MMMMMMMMMASVKHWCVKQMRESDRRAIPAAGTPVAAQAVPYASPAADHVWIRERHTGRWGRADLWGMNSGGRAGARRRRVRLRQQTNLPLRTMQRCITTAKRSIARVPAPVPTCAARYDRLQQPPQRAGALPDITRACTQRQGKTISYFNSI